MTELKAGDKAPNFKGNIQDGTSRSLVDYKGKKLVLYFYPKDMTPGCTTQSCDLRDNHDRLKAAGYEILGVSPDDEKKHVKFIEKHELTFDLLADPEKETCSAYGVWGEKSMYGRKYMGVFRTTFLINEDGIIDEVISKVKTKEHTAQILK